jgi:hypothetical protein
MDTLGVALLPENRQLRFLASSDRLIWKGAEGAWV